jgi:phosphatidylserine decarboxylase
MDTDDSPTFRDRLFVATQYLIPQHLLSRLVYRLTRSRIPTVKNALIKSFMRGFSPDMSDALQPDPLAYGSFNEFFTRALRPGARPIDPNGSILVSPVDGAISQMGRLDGSQLVQAKGHHYSLEALLDSGASATDWASRFAGGCFATLYLAPFNYHRIHMPLSGTLCAAWYVPGKLFSVNAVTAAAVPGLFARNERVVCIFEEGPRLFAMVLVGALFVGSMETVWHGESTQAPGITPRSHPRAVAPREGSRTGPFQHGLDGASDTPTRHCGLAAEHPAARQRMGGTAPCPTSRRDDDGEPWLTGNPLRRARRWSFAPHCLRTRAISLRIAVFWKLTHRLW